MKNIEITVVKKVAYADGMPTIVCGNNDYTLSFVFDDEWSDELHKVARFSFVKNGLKGFIDVPIENDTCKVPVLLGIGLVRVGVYAGDLRTTTGAKIKCTKSILCDDAEVMDDPFENLYEKINKTIDNLPTCKEITEKSTDSELPSAKAVYEYGEQIKGEIPNIVDLDLEVEHNESDIYNANTTNAVLFEVATTVEAFEKELNGVQAQVDGLGFVDVNKLDHIDGHINKDGIWEDETSGFPKYSFVLIPVKPDEVVRIKANGKGAYITCLEEFTGVVSGQLASIKTDGMTNSKGENISTRQTISGSNEETYKIQSGTKYLWLCTVEAGINKMPVILTIDGYDILRSAKDIISSKVDKTELAEVETAINENVHRLISENLNADEKFNLISETINRNKFDSTKFEKGWLVDGGVVDSKQTSWATSDYIPITDGLDYKLCYWNNTKILYIRPRKLCLYNENKEYIADSYVEGTSLPHSGTFTGASYVRMSISASQTDIAILLLEDTNTDGITGYIPYGITRTYKLDESVQLRPEHLVIAVGDSITYGSKQAGGGYADMIEGVSYMTNACKNLGFKLENYSISSSTLGLASDGTNPHQALIERYTGMSDDADLVYIAMGTNDWFYHFELGEMTDRVKTTFYGALHLLCQGLKDKYPTTPIVFASPIKRWINREGDNALAGNLNYDKKELNLWRNAIKEVCEYHSIPIVDMYAESFLNAWEEIERTKYIPDGTHPNGAGHKKMQITCEAILNKYLGDYYI
jgi:lysophospholipase L1-like esterase